MAAKFCYEEQFDIVKDYEARHGNQLRAFHSTTEKVVPTADGAFLDSACNSHMWEDIQVLTEVEELPEEFRIQSAYNGSRLVGTHIGKLNLRVMNCFDQTTMITLSGIIYVPNLTARLISVPKVTEHDLYGVNFRKQYADIYDTSMDEVVASSYDDNCVKILAYTHETFNAITNPALTCQDDTNVPSADKNREIVELWHRRTGHISAKYMNQLSQNAVNVPMFRDTEIIIRQCKVCALSKSMQNAHGGYKIILTLIDVFSGYITAFAMKLKAELTATFAEFYKKVESRFPGELIAYLRCDNAP